MITRRSLLRFATLAGAVPAWRAARAQAWPSRYIRLVVPFPPGGGTDAVARILANRLSEVWGQQVVIENRGGAGGNMAFDTAARAEPDGHTMLIAAIGIGINRYLYGSVNYEVADFAPVSLICVFPNLMAVPNSSPAKSVQEFIAYAKANRGRVTYGSSGTGTSTHLAGELFKRMAGVELTHVPYRGVAPVINDLIPGRVDVTFNTIGGLLPQVRAGNLRALAVTTPQRFPSVPEIPTIAESGVPGFDVSSWYGFFVPARTPAPIVAKMHADTVALLAEPALKDQLEKLGVMVVGSTPQALATQLKSEIDKWAPIIRENRIKAED
ncbi:MAG TPA: tripartite tricarboxylate transporter substrate binding protein [Xanthobacteraceae bacterium]